MKRFAESMRGTAKKILPESFIHEAQRFRAFDANERRVYLKLRISNSLRFSNKELPRAPKTARRLVFVCFGNIIRSPICQALMQRELDRIGRTEFTVASAGLNATEGRLAHPWAVAAGRELGISLEKHRATLLTLELIDQADAIFVMDYQNQVQLISRWAGARGKVFMLAAYAAPEYRSVEIPDPYYEDLERTRNCYQVINNCIQTLIRDLER